MSRWIKVDVSTPDKGEIIDAAALCGISQGDAFLAFFRLYAWLDEQTTDGWLPRITPRIIDARACQPGFGDALARVGWLTFQPDGCMVTNWCAHNGQCAKRRAQQAVRMTKLREEQRNAGQVVRPCPRRPSR